MVQNSYSYAASDWQDDMTTAASIGIDGFALNIAQADYEVGQLANAFSVAEQMGFNLFFSFDMSYSWASSDMVSIVQTYADSSAMFKWENAVLVSTYAGDSYGDDFWSGLKSALASDGITISLAPAFTTYRDPSLADSLMSKSIDGFFNWWSWPADVNANLTTATDLAYQAVVKSDRTGPYIICVPMAIQEGTSDTDWVDLIDTLCYEIVTWNDYAESHYIGDINPNVNLGDLAPNYVNGFVHANWRNVAQYFISWYKTGSALVVTNDQVIFWYRGWPKAATYSTGSPPRNSDFPVDAVFALALLSSEASVQLYIGSNSFPGTLRLAPAWEAWHSRPRTRKFCTSRSCATAPPPRAYGSLYVHQTGCTYYNFNPWVGIIE